MKINLTEPQHNLIMETLNFNWINVEFEKSIFKSSLGIEQRKKIKIAKQIVQKILEGYEVERLKRELVVDEFFREVKK